MFTLEPSSSGEQGWDDFLIGLQRFRLVARRHAHLQSIACPAAEHVAKAFGERVKLFARCANATDPVNRLRNSYLPTSWARSVGLGSQARYDLALMDSNSDR